MTFSVERSVGPSSLALAYRQHIVAAVATWTQEHSATFKAHKDGRLTFADFSITLGWLHKRKREVSEGTIVFFNSGNEMCVRCTFVVPNKILSILLFLLLVLLFVPDFFILFVVAVPLALTVVAYYADTYWWFVSSFRKLIAQTSQEAEMWAALRQRSAWINDTGRCPACGTPVDSEQQTCSSCGLALL